MATMTIGDLVRISEVHPLAKYTGRIVALDEPSSEGQEIYVVHINQTGLIQSFLESQLELIKKAK